MQRSSKRCVYCEAESRKLTRDHVFPRGLFPPAENVRKVQRLTVAACELCNNSFSDDEAHFRFVIALAGPANESVTSVWRRKVAPSFDERNGRRRLRDVMALTEGIVVDGEDRLKIYPARDERVLRIVRKSVRALIHVHDLGPVPPDAQVWADIQRFALLMDI